ncbi:MAG TPA: hypothetical protein VJ063_08295 [Verrucomicrobiae bacterium]|nr:hypothetical protein [Verrucomicrobiae bacterium]
MKTHVVVRWLVLLSLISFQAIVAAREISIPLGGGGNPPNPAAPIPPRTLNRLKQQEPFKTMTDEQIYQRMVCIRTNVLKAIEALRVEDAKVADCLLKLYDANRFVIMFGSGAVKGRLQSDGSADCDDFSLGISIEIVPCDDRPLYQQLGLLTTLLHEGRHAGQDFRVDESGLDEDHLKAAKREKDQYNEIDAHEETVRVLSELNQVLRALEEGMPIPEDAKGLPRWIGEAIQNDPNLSPEEKRQLATRLRFDSGALENGNELVINCRYEAKELLLQFLEGGITKAEMNAGLATNGWFLEYGDELQTGPIAYFGEGKTKRFSQVGLGTNRTFVITGVDQLYAFALLPGGRKAVFAGADTTSGDGILLGYSDTDGDRFLDEDSRTELVRSLDLAGGVHLAINPANNVLMALNRSDNSLLRLPDTDNDLFPNFVSIAGEFTFERDDLLYLSFSPDGTNAYASIGEEVIQRGTKWAVARATDPNGYFAADGEVNLFAEQPALPAFVGIPLNGQPFVWISGAAAADIYLHAVDGATRQLLGTKTLDDFGHGVIYLESPLEAGLSLQLEDLTHDLLSPLVEVELPHLNIARAQQRIIVDWPGFGYKLQQAFRLPGLFFDVNGGTSPEMQDVLRGYTNGTYFRLEKQQGRATLALEDPCPDGRLLVRHAYSECQSNGTWHVVEDAWYACPPNGQAKKFRVYDLDTGQPCTPTLPPPNPEGGRYRKVDSTCLSPIPTGEKVVLMECRNGMWDEATYNVVICSNNERRLDGPVSTVPARPPTECDKPPPKPAAAQ